MQKNNSTNHHHSNTIEGGLSKDQLNESSNYLSDDLLELMMIGLELHLIMEFTILAFTLTYLGNGLIK
jgi:hypothetical protein